MKYVFSYNSDTNKTAYLNWRTNLHEPIHNMLVLANGYIKAAIELAKCCLDDNSDKKADVIVFPMVFSLNQGIELYGKAIYWSMNILLENKNPYPENHNISEIWYAVKGKIKQFGFDEKEGRSEKEFFSMIVILEKYLTELYKKISMDGSMNTTFHNMDFSRYPLDKRMKEHFYIKESNNVVIDLENFISVSLDIYECLERLSGYYYELVLEKWKSDSEI